MKELQSDFTTPEQSELLLKLGVPKESANHVYLFRIDESGNYTFLKDPFEISNLMNINWDYLLRNFKSAYLPCWSAGRLAEIYNIISMDYVVDELILNWSPFEYSYIEYIIDKLRENINKGLVDFSKLEK